jgi:hypothetical protein
MRAWRPKYSEQAEEERRKSVTRAYAGVYLRRGKIERQPCIVCSAFAQMHHPDYSKPLDVVWLCESHHREHHQNT